MNFRSYLPFDNYKLLTKLTETEVKDRIGSITQPRKTFRLFSRTREKSYQGKFNDDTFKIGSIISGRNSFLPIIKGSISTY